MDTLTTASWAQDGENESRQSPHGLVRRSASIETVLFRNFRVLPGERLLLRDDCPVELGSRAFDLLMVLLRSRGDVVGKDEIVDYVWPSTLVDESNLRFQMACLRRALGDDRDVIKTIQGRGYLFVVEGGVNGLPGGPPEVFLPKPAETPPARAVEATLSRPTGPALVAVIDDDDDTREALDGLLRSAGLCVESFPSAQAFVDAGNPRDDRVPHS